MTNQVQMFPLPPILSKEEQREILTSVCGAMVEDFVDISTFVKCDKKEENQNQNKKQDKVLGYAKEVLSFGQSLKELVDTVREGDSLRVLRWWKLMLLIFKATGRKNYSIEAFVLSAQQRYLLSPRERLYSRFINTHCIHGKTSAVTYIWNISIEDAIRALGANKTPKAINRLGKCITPLADLLDKFDCVHQVAYQRADHVLSADKDVTCMVNELHGA